MPQNITLEINWVVGECQIYQMNEYHQSEDVLEESASESEKVLLCFNHF